MPRNSLRRFTLTLILALVLALPAAAAGRDEGMPARGVGWLSWIWGWVGSLWTIAAGEDPDSWRPATAEAGPLIDPNGIK